ENKFFNFYRSDTGPSYRGRARITRVQQVHSGGCHGRLMDPHPINLNDITLFVEVARRKSFSLAARALAMPTSTLSRRISQLEQAIGLRLINRNTRRLELTDAGAAYLQRCQGLVDE